MERVGALAILALLLLCGSARAESSLEVQSSCRQLAKASDAADAKLTIARNFDDGFCCSAFAALQGVSASRWPDSNKAILGFCAPSELHSNRFHTNIYALYQGASARNRYSICTLGSSSVGKCFPLFRR